MSVIDMTGQKYGLLTVLERASHASAKVHWRCRCECGRTTVSAGSALRSGATKSCGCVATGKLLAKIKTHGRSQTRLYGLWRAMIERCERPSHRSYYKYGARGISVCERWHDFANFLADMGEQPPGKSLDRINNDGNYEPGNCRWATAKEQSQNTRRNRYFEFQGKRQCVAEWARETGIREDLLRYRHQKGWPAELALTLKPSRGNRLVAAQYLKQPGPTLEEDWT